jgi:hypothetical protein
MIVRAGVGRLILDARLVHPRSVRHVHLAADDRLDAGRLHRVVELDRAEHVAVVGDRAGGHAELGNSLREVFRASSAVEKRIFGVEMEMDEGHSAVRSILAEKRISNFEFRMTN